MRHLIAAPVTTGVDAEGSAMKPRITVLPEGVDDPERSPRFSRDGLGRVSEAIVG
jgi:hypothetical protein